MIAIRHERVARAAFRPELAQGVVSAGVNG
jgi:hypothetical protein